MWSITGGMKRVHMCACVCVHGPHKAYDIDPMSFIDSRCHRRSEGREAKSLLASFARGRLVRQAWLDLVLE